MAGVIIVIAGITSIILQFIFRVKILLPQIFGILAYFIALEGLSAYANREWVKQFASMVGISNVRILKSGTREEDWSSGGYTYIRYFVISADTDLAGVNSIIKNRVDLSSLHYKEEYLPIHPKGIGRVKFQVDYLSPLQREELGVGQANTPSGNGDNEFVAKFVFDVSNSN